MTASLRDIGWPRFLKAPDGQLVARLYEPGLRRAVAYERCCAYFSSSVLSAAAAGFGAFIERILTGEITQKPALHLLVNEELSESDVEALLQRGEDEPLINKLLERFGTPANALQKRRLEMLAWLARDRWLEVRVGVLRLGGGILHAKFGLFTDAAGDRVVFQGSDNESANGVRGHYEELEISGSWTDPERDAYYHERFKTLWGGTDPTVATLSLPQAIREKLIRFVREKPPPVREAEDDLQRRRAAMLWGYALAAPFMPDRGAGTCDAMAPVVLWPHQRGVVTEAAGAWPAGRLLCDEVGMGKTVEAILVLRRLLAGRGVARALILSPANLLPQWQGELREKGGLRVPRLDGPRKLVWPDGSEQAVSGLAEALDRPLLLLSRETARTEGNLPILLAAKPWDLVLLDEGHAARRANQVEGEFNSPTLLLGLLRRLQATGQVRSILILSATPMQTHPWEPWDLLQVLGEGGLWLSGFHVVRRFYEAVARLETSGLSRDDAVGLARILAMTPDLPKPPDELGLHDPCDTSGFAETLRFLPASRRNEAVRWLRSCSPLLRRMHRNTRQTLRRYYEMGLLDRPPPKRDVREDPFDFATEEERSTYDAVKHYIDRRFEELEQQRAGKGFVMTIYRRRAASSPVALRKSLERREKGLKAVIAQRAYDDTVLDVEDAQELQDLLNVQLTSALPDSPPEAEAELRQVQGLLERIENLGGLDTKRDRVINWIKHLTADGRSVLVFTSYADTMEYLRDAVLSAGVPVASYSGDGGAIRANGKWVIVAKEDVTATLGAGKLRALVCTDAASEGLNLQAAGALINFDLPWNPSKVEQRIGRIDRIGQALGVLPIVNLYLKDSVDQRVYRALAQRCGLFERYVGPMQPVLSRAMRMLAGREHIDEKALADLAREIEDDPTVTEAFPDDDPAELPIEPPLIGPQDTESLLAALDGSGIEVRAETNSRHVVDDGSLRIVTDVSAVALHPEAGCIDGLDALQWTLLRQLQRPGERLPLILVSIESDAFRVIMGGWVRSNGTEEVNSFTDVKRLVAEWDGSEPLPEAWNTARIELEGRAREVIEQLRARAKSVVAREREQQREAARLRVIEELGRMLICFPPDTDDLNRKFHRLASEPTPTAERLKAVYNRLGAYPEWSSGHLADLRAFRNDLSPPQTKTRLTGRELDAALADPRWETEIGPGS